MIIFDNKKRELLILGTPREDQLVGSPLERLCELSGRICYDSIGTKNSRGSKDYHKHIIDVGHGSVWEHAVFTIICYNVGDYSEFLNRSGVWVTPIDDDSCRLTLNLRAAREWHLMTSPSVKDIHGSWVRFNAHKVAPQIVQPHPSDYTFEEDGLVNPIDDNEIWVSTFLVGSRGFSHELVRHGDWTAISQRSTRFCNENESVYCQHPLFIEKIHPLKGEIVHINDVPIGDLFWFNEVIHTKMAGNHGTSDNGIIATVNGMVELVSLKDRATILEEQEKRFYSSVCSVLKPILESDGLDRLAALKQSRGAARGFLANNLSTEIVFSASIAQWKRIFKQRVSAFADREINDILAVVKEQMVKEGYLDFKD